MTQNIKVEVGFGEVVTVAYLDLLAVQTKSNQNKSAAIVRKNYVVTTDNSNPFAVYLEKYNCYVYAK